MIKKVTQKKEILYILNNLRNEDEQELKALWGTDWIKKTIKSMEGKEVLILYGFNDEGKSVPISMGGFVPMFAQSNSVACVWMLSTNFIYKNKKLFVKELLEQLKQASLRYEIMYNYIYKSNRKSKKWLKKLGFNFNNPKPEGLNLEEGFEFFYKRNPQIK